MVGLIQILTYLLCIYLVFKGVEIFQTAFVSPADGDRRSWGMAIGAIMIVLAVLIGIGFASWVDEQAESISRASVADRLLR